MFVSECGGRIFMMTTTVCRGYDRRPGLCDRNLKSTGVIWPVANRDDISEPTWSGETGKCHGHYLWLRSIVLLAITSLLILQKIPVDSPLALDAFTTESREHVTQLPWA